MDWCFYIYIRVQVNMSDVGSIRNTHQNGIRIYIIIILIIIAFPHDTLLVITMHFPFSLMLPRLVASHDVMSERRLSCSFDTSQFE